VYWNDFIFKKNFFRTGWGEWAISLGACIAGSDYRIAGIENYRIKWEIRGIVVVIVRVDGSYQWILRIWG